MIDTHSQLTLPKPDLIANVFDTLPQPAFVVDHGFRLVEFNLAGAKLLDRVPFAVLRLRCGDRLQCTHSTETADGTPTEACPECISKNFVRGVFDGAKSYRKTGRLRLSSQGEVEEVEFLITVAPLPGEPEPLALLILDDAQELSALLQPEARPVTPASSSPDSKVPAKARAHKMGSS